MEVWDPHFHIWDVSEGTKSGHDPEQLFAPNENPVYSWDLYEKDMQVAGNKFRHTGGAFVEAVSVCHVEKTGEEFASTCLTETQWVSSQLSHSGKNYVIVSSAPLEDSNIANILSHLAEDSKVRGIRQIINYQPSWPRNKKLGDLLGNHQWKQGYAALSHYSLSYDLQLNPHQFKEAVRLMEKHPETPVIIGHLGSPTINDLNEKKDVYWDGLKALADQDNTFIKISMLSYIDKNWDQNSLVQETVLRVIDLFGVDRCFFASNSPVEKNLGWDASRLYKEFVNLIANQYSQEDQQKIFADNAKKAYRAETIQR